MGFFDKIKNAIGSGEKEKDVTVAPSQLLRDAGIDPGGLKFSFGTGSIGVSGTIANEAERSRILEILNGINGINNVQDNMVVAAPAAPEPEAAPPAPGRAAEQAPAEADEAKGKTYTVKPGDTLWKIAEQMYGSGSKYMKIFEANTDLLENPDKIFPGQELKIPELED